MGCGCWVGEAMGGRLAARPVEDDDARDAWPSGKERDITRWERSACAIK